MIYFQIAGLETNIEFIKDLCDHPKFQAGEVHTGFIKENYETLFPELRPSDEILSQGALALLIAEQSASLTARNNRENLLSAFDTTSGFRLNYELDRHFEFSFMDEKCRVHVQYVKSGGYLMRVNDKEPAKLVTGTSIVQGDTILLTSEIDGKKQKSRIVRVGRELHVFTNVSKNSSIDNPANYLVFSSNNKIECWVGSKMEIEDSRATLRQDAD